MQDLSDKDLLSQYLNTDDNKVLGELYNRYVHLVYGVCLKYLKNTDKAKDEVLNIFEKLINEIHEHDINNFKSWLYVVAKNHCLMSSGKKKSDQKNQENYQYEINNHMEITQQFHHINELMQKEKKYDYLEECLKELKNEQKDCVESFYLEKKTYQEVSNIFSIELKKVKSYIQNGKRNLKICIENKIGSK